jgi:hypothetical protein
MTLSKPGLRAGEENLVICLNSGTGVIARKLASLMRLYVIASASIWCLLKQAMDVVNIS